MLFYGGIVLNTPELGLCSLPFWPGHSERRKWVVRKESAEAPSAGGSGPSLSRWSEPWSELLFRCAWAWLVTYPFSLDTVTCTHTSALHHRQHCADWPSSDRPQASAGLGVYLLGRCSLFKSVAPISQQCSPLLLIAAARALLYFFLKKHNRWKPKNPSETHPFGEDDPVPGSVTEKERKLLCVPFARNFAWPPWETRSKLTKIDGWNFLLNNLRMQMSLSATSDNFLKLSFPQGLEEELHVKFRTIRAASLWSGTAFGQALIVWIIIQAIRKSIQLLLPFWRL